MNKTGEPAAWLVDGGEYQYVSLFRESADAAANEEGGTVTPLYRSPTLTAEEREAIHCVVGDVADITGPVENALRGLLERLK